MFNEVLKINLDNSIRELENEFLDTSRPFQIVIDNINTFFLLIIPPPPPANQITLFDAEQRYQTNFGLNPAYTITMPLLNYHYGAFLEEIQNNPIKLGKIRFESLTNWRGFNLISNISQFGQFVQYNSNNVGDSIQTGMDISLFVNQNLPNIVEWYGDFTIDGLTSMLFNFPSGLAALRITCYMQKSASLKQMLLTGKLFQNYFPVPENIIVQKDLLQITDGI